MYILIFLSSLCQDKLLSDFRWLNCSLNTFVICRFVISVLLMDVWFFWIKVAPAELEALLLSHPAVLDCAVIP